MVKNRTYRSLSSMFMLLTSTCDEYEIGFVRYHKERDSQLQGDNQAAQIGHIYVIVKMRDLFRTKIDLEKKLYMVQALI